MSSFFGESETVATLYSVGSLPLMAFSSLLYSVLGISLKGTLDEDVYDSQAAIPTEFAVSAYPNPFNPSTTLKVALPELNNVTVAIFNLMGQEMMRLAPGELYAGHHTFTIDGSSWSSGLYFVRVQAGHHSDTQRILMMK